MKWTRGKNTYGHLGLVHGFLCYRTITVFELATCMLRTILRTCSYFYTHMYMEHYDDMPLFLAYEKEC